MDESQSGMLSSPPSTSSAFPDRLLRLTEDKFRIAPPKTKEERLKGWTGQPTKRYRHMGVWIVSTGDVENSQVPGDHFELVVINDQGEPVRTLQQMTAVDADVGLDEDPDVLVDVDEGGHIEVIHQNYSELSQDPDLFLTIYRRWANQHGRPEYAL